MSEPEPEMPRKVDPDLGRTQPTNEERLQQTDLAIRARKLRHMEEQRKMVEEANALTRHPE